MFSGRTEYRAFLALASRLGPDCTSIFRDSKSAPNNLGLSYLENYMKNKEKKTTEDKSIQILGSSPAQNSNNISYYLDKSVKSVNSFFNYFNYK